MELRHFRYFCAVADWRGFNRAARALHVSQSAISEQILDLEHEIGVALLHRNQRQISLTPEGEVFLEEARKVLSAADRAVEVAQRYSRGESGPLTVGFLVWATGKFFAPIIREFRRLYPGVRLSLMEMAPAQQSEALVSGSIDIGFTRPLRSPYDRLLRSETLYADPFVAVLPVDHPLANRPLRLGELSDQPFIVCDRSLSPTLFDKITAICAEAGFSPRITQTSNVLSSVLTLVEAGEGVTLIPSSLQHYRFSDLSYCPLIEPTGTIELVMAWSPEREGGIQKAFLNFMHNQKESIQESVRPAFSHGKHLPT